MGPGGNVVLIYSARLNDTRPLLLSGCLPAPAIHCYPRVSCCTQTPPRAKVVVLGSLLFISFWPLLFACACPHGAPLVVVGLTIVFVAFWCCLSRMGARPWQIHRCHCSVWCRLCQDERHHVAFKLLPIPLPQPHHHSRHTFKVQRSRFYFLEPGFEFPESWPAMLLLRPLRLRALHLKFGMLRGRDPVGVAGSQAASRFVWMWSLQGAPWDGSRQCSCEVEGGFYTGSPQ